MAATWFYYPPFGGMVANMGPYQEGAALPGLPTSFPLDLIEIDWFVATPIGVRPDISSDTGAYRYRGVEGGPEAGNGTFGAPTVPPGADFYVGIYQTGYSNFIPAHTAESLSPAQYATTGRVLSVVNDNFADALALNPAGGSVVFDMTEATSEPGEPLFSGAQAQTLWYTLEVDEPRIAILTTLGSPGAPDTNLQALIATSASSYTEVVAFDDDSGSLVPGESSFEPYLVFRAYPGYVYRIQLGTYETTASGTLTWSLQPFPAAEWHLMPGRPDIAYADLGPLLSNVGLTWPLGSLVPRDAIYVHYIVSQPGGSGQITDPRGGYGKAAARPPTDFQINDYQSVGLSVPNPHLFVTVWQADGDPWPVTGPAYTARSLAPEAYRGEIRDRRIYSATLTNELIITPEPDSWSEANGNVSDGVRPYPLQGWGWRNASADTNAEHSDIDGPVIAVLSETLALLLCSSQWEDINGGTFTAATLTVRAIRRTGAALELGPVHDVLRKDSRDDGVDRYAWFTNRQMLVLTPTRAYANFGPEPSTELSSTHLIIDVDPVTLACTSTLSAGPELVAGNGLVYSETDGAAAVDASTIMTFRRQPGSGAGNRPARVGLALVQPSGVVTEDPQNYIVVLATQVYDVKVTRGVGSGVVLALGHAPTTPTSPLWATFAVTGGAPVLLDSGALVDSFFEDFHPESHRLVEPGRARLSTYNLDGANGYVNAVLDLQAGYWQTQEMSRSVVKDRAGAPLTNQGSRPIDVDGQRTAHTFMTDTPGGNHLPSLLFRPTPSEAEGFLFQVSPESSRSRLPSLLRYMGDDCWLYAYRDDGDILSRYIDPSSSYFRAGEHQYGIYARIVKITSPQLVALLGRVANGPRAGVVRARSSSAGVLASGPQRSVARTLGQGFGPQKSLRPSP